MNIEIKVEMKRKDGTVITLSEEESSALYTQLNLIYGKEIVGVPYYPTIPYVEPYRPWRDVWYTTSDGTNIKLSYNTNGN